MMKRTNFYTQNQQSMARALLVVWLLTSCSPDVTLAVPDREGAIVPATTSSPCQLTLPRVATSPAMAPPVGTTVIAQGGHRVTFLQNHGVWQAEVDEHLPVGFSRKLYLPVYIEKGLHWQQLATCSAAIQRQRVAVDFTPGSGYVYVGSRGLRGGNSQPLHTAVAQGELGQVRKILEKGKADINAVDQEGRSALHWAVIMDQDEIAGLLLRHGADAALQDQQDNTPLDYADQKAKDAEYFSTIGTLVQLLSTLEDLIKANLADGTQNQGEIAQKMSDIRSLLVDLEAVTPDQEQYLHFKSRYHWLQVSYLRATGEERGASLHEELAKLYQGAANTYLSSIPLDEQESAPLLTTVEDMVFYQKQGDDSWTRAMDCWYAQQGAWDLLTILGQEDLAHLRADQLNALRLKNARLAYEFYLSCCQTAAKKQDLRSEINLRCIMALRLYAIGGRLEAKICALNACRKLVNSSNTIRSMLVANPSKAIRVQDLMKARAVLAKVQGMQPMYDWPSSRRMNVAYHKDLAEIGKELILKDLAEIGKELILKVSGEEILWTQQRAKRYKQVGMGTILASRVFFCGLCGLCGTTAFKFGKNRSQILQLFSIGLVTLSPLFLFGGTVLQYGRSLCGKGESLIEEAGACQKLNSIMKQALAYHNRGNMQKFINRLTKEYGKGKQLLELKNFRHEVPAEKIINTLTEHGFRPDGIAYLFNLIGEAFMSDKVSIPGFIPDDLASRARDSFMGSLREELAQSAKDLDERVAEIGKASLANARKSYLQELKDFLLFRAGGYLAREHLENGQVMPFVVRLEARRNVAKLNIALIRIVSGERVAINQAKELAIEIRNSLDRYSQYRSYSSMQLVENQLEKIEKLLD